jgi:hypothetical protein
MTFRRYHALRDYWAEHPPADFFAAGYFGYKPPGRETAPKNSLDDFIRAVNSRR